MRYSKVYIFANFYLMIGLLFLTMSAAYGDAQTTKAIGYYQSAEELFQNRQYQGALLLYKKAIAEKPDDEKIIVDVTVKTKLTPYGRSLKTTQTKNTTYVDYFPNKRIHAINERILEQARLAHPPVLALKWIALREPSRDQILNGGETATIVVNVSNSGESAALDVVIFSDMLDSEHLDFYHELYVGTIEAKKNRTVELKIKVARDIEDKNNGINIVAIEKGGLSSNELDVAITTKTHRPAALAFGDFSIQDRSSDTLIEPGEPVSVIARLSNNGFGVAENVVAHIELGDNVFLGPESAEKHQLGDIFPGESKDFTFTFLTNGKFKNNQAIPVAVSASEKLENRDNTVRHELKLSMRVPNKKVVISINPSLEVNSSSNFPLLIDVDNDIPVTRIKKHNAVAVVIGNRNYRQSTVPLVKYALNDAQIVKKYLINILGYVERNIIYLQDATSAKFNETFGSRSNYAGKLFNFIKPNQSEVFIYYSGHGAPDLKNKNAYFVPVDVDPAYIATSGYSLELFYNNIAKLGAKSITVVLDTCFSGNSSGGSVIPGIRPASIHLNVTRPNIKNLTVFTSSGADEISSWYAKQRHGLFTYYFLKGLRGTADTDNNSMITSNELADYLSAHVPYEARRQGHEQSPSLIQSKNKIIADFRLQ